MGNFNEASVRFKLRDAKAKTETALYLRFRFTNHQQDGSKAYKTITVPINLRIHPKQWNSRRNLPVESGKYYTEDLEFLEAELKRIRREAKDKFNEYVVKNESYPKNANDLKPHIQQILIDKQALKKRISLLEYIDLTIKDTKNNNYKKGFKLLKKKLTDFSKETGYPIEFESISKEFKVEFVDYLEDNGYSGSYIHSLFKRLRTILKEADSDDLTENRYFLSKKFMPSNFSPKKIALTEEEVETLYKLDLTGNKRLSDIRDLFLIQCYTALRFSDALRIRKKHIKQGNSGLGIEIDIKKLENRIEWKPIANDNLKSILDKHNGAPRITNSLKADSINAMMNVALKKIMMQIPSMNAIEEIEEMKGGKKTIVKYKRHELVSTHTGRRTFCTIEYERGTKPELIRAISGHKDNTELFNYIKKSNRFDPERWRKERGQSKTKVFSIAS